MSFDARTLFELLPAIHRIRDKALAEALDPTDPEKAGPLEELLSAFAEQVAVVEENMEQLYDDLFIETCAEWATPYIGDLIGYQTLHGEVPSVASPRAEVAHTIALRRRKGTALVLEQLARDVTGWDARAVEFFELLCTTQYMNHTRPHSQRCPNLRDGDALDWIGTAFESTSRSVDVRRIDSGRGRHNIPNIGLFLWRLDGYSRTDSPAVRVGPRRYRVGPLDNDVALYGRPVVEEDITQIADPFHVPTRLSRRHLRRHLGRYYGTRATAGAEPDNAEPSLLLTVDGVQIERDEIDVCNLEDDGALWAHTPPAGRVSVDPQLGRVALPPEARANATVTATWHEGFSADLGGGEYERGKTLPVPDAPPVHVPDDQPTIALALAALGGTGVVEITDSGRYEEDLLIQVADSGNIEIRAQNGKRPVLVVTQPLDVTGGADSGFGVNGLLVTGAPLRVPDVAANTLTRLALTHTTLVPGWGLTAEGLPTNPAEPSLVIEVPAVAVRLERSIIGGVRCHERSGLVAEDSVVDATVREGVAFAELDGASPGGTLSLEECTVIGKVHVAAFGLVSNSILLAGLAEADAWPAPVRAIRKQVGCIRFSFLPFDSVVPRRYRCQPDSAETALRVAPLFTSLRYGAPAYCQLSARTVDPIRRGADDESEMGVLHHLYGPQREANLRIRLREYLRVGLRAGIFYES